MSLAYDPKVEELESKAMSAWVSIGFAPKEKMVDLWWNGERHADCVWNEAVGIWLKQVGEEKGGMRIYKKIVAPTHYSLPLPGPNT